MGGVSGTDSTPTPDLAAFAADLAQVQDNIRHLQEAESDLKAQIRKLAGPGTYTAGGLQVVISTNRRFDPKLAAKAIPAETIPLVSKSVIDPAKAKALNEITHPDWYAQCFTEFEMRVSLK